MIRRQRPDRSKIVLSRAAKRSRRRSSSRGSGNQHGSFEPSKSGWFGRTLRTVASLTQAFLIRLTLPSLASLRPLGGDFETRRQLLMPSIAALADKPPITPTSTSQLTFSQTARNSNRPKSRFRPTGGTGPVTTPLSDYPASDERARRDGRPHEITPACREHLRSRSPTDAAIVAHDLCRRYRMACSWLMSWSGLLLAAGLFRSDAWDRDRTCPPAGAIATTRSSLAMLEYFAQPDSRSVRYVQRIGLHCLGSHDGISSKQRSDKDTDEAPPPSRFLVRQGSSGWMVYDRQRKGPAVIGSAWPSISRKHKLIASSGCWQPRRNTSVPVEQIRPFGRWCAIAIVHAASATMRPSQRHPASSYSMQISNRRARER